MCLNIEKMLFLAGKEVTEAESSEAIPSKLENSWAEVEVLESSQNQAQLILNAQVISSTTVDF